ncbi:LacI family DNA-binding transcriptional regulator [Weissella halotolerans]|uniref:LacI family transcriptional regulator n=1 Tax=Weissella halotolerans DSM 20190 TaxID=1123500 RepID=A0A0R2FVB4_9LACO|nr:LacI family DNA-binding transcriptional regulator [Weissella halotolerans]KRN32355.1 LacI family transcriptional regulator [Weissella halotolerans DSM 20190]
MVVKLGDVAERAGVSVTTVSRVINRYGSLSQKTINKVEQAMRDLHYQPNAMARAMQGKRSKIIGLIFPNILNPFYAELVNRIEQQLFSRGYRMMLVSSADNPAREEGALAMLQANQVEGIITGSHNLNIREYHDLHLPIVSFDRYLSDQIPIVQADHSQAGQLTAQYVLSQDCTNVLIVVDPDMSSSPTLARIECAEKVLHDYQVATKRVTMANVYEEIASQDYDAIIPTNDLDAVDLIRYIQGSQQDCLVIGYDGTQLMRRLFPNLVTIQQPITALAQQLIETLLAVIDQQTVPKVTKVPFIA